MTRSNAPKNADPLLDPAQLGVFLRARGLPPLDRFGQHFLADRAVLADILAASRPDPTTPVIEIGAGLGVLTRALALARTRPGVHPFRQPTPLIAVELDRRLIPLLRERVREFPFVRVVEGDILRTPPEELLAPAAGPPPARYDVVGNIPYNITARILRKFLAHPPRPRAMTLLVDAAVAETIAAAPPRMSLRAVSVQAYATPAIIGRRVLPAAFVPPPAVSSAILRLETRAAPRVPANIEQAFFRLVRAGFSQKRKILANALAATTRVSPREAARRLRRARINPSRRAETLSLAEWIRLRRAWESPER